MKLKILLLFLVTTSQVTLAQDSLFSKIAKENTLLFTYENEKFNGEGWDHVLQYVGESQNVLIGEDHFSNEIPAFFKAIGKSTQFDNFYIEVDPYSTAIIESTFKDMTDVERKEFNKIYSDLYSFYALKPEYELLEQMVKSGAGLLGSDQIVMYGDRLIFQEIIKTTKNEDAKSIYASIISKSGDYLEAFLQNPEKGMYFMTPEFSGQLEELQKLPLSDMEKDIIDKMKKSVTIYGEQSHSKRVKLILHHLMEYYPKWKDSKNLFKYGANHLCRGESFLTVYDIGNVVANITAGNFQDSFHLMIVGESGALGSPFRTFPPSPVDTENGFYLSYLKPFFEITQSNDWYLFDLRPLRKAVNRNQLKIEDLSLHRLIKGYDALVIIPEVSPAKF